MDHSKDHPKDHLKYLLSRRKKLRQEQQESPEPPKKEEEEISLGTDAARMAANSARYLVPDRSGSGSGSGSSDVTKLAKLLRKKSPLTFNPPPAPKEEDFTSINAYAEANKQYEENELKEYLDEFIASRDEEEKEAISDLISILGGARKSRRVVRKSRRVVRKSRRNVRKSKRSVRKSRRNVRKSKRVVRKSRKSVRKTRRNRRNARK